MSHSGSGPHTLSPQTGVHSPSQPVVSTIEQLAEQTRVPVPSPKAAHVRPPKSVPSHASVPSFCPLLQLGPEPHSDVLVRTHETPGLRHMSYLFGGGIVSSPSPHAESGDWCAHRPRGDYSMRLFLFLALAISACTEAQEPPALPLYQSSTCQDGVLGQQETDVDCGGACAPCSDGRICAGDDDCLSDQCATGRVCRPQTCGNGAEDPGESGVDCGGACGACPGDSCSSDGDCATGYCTDDTCGVASCTDATRNGNESDVDCGAECPACADGDDCLLNQDCQSEYCQMRVCTAPSCTDGTKNQHETDVDCGGGCSPCALGRTCETGADCVTGLCQANVCTQIASNCDDGEKNGQESDVDCGGSCPACGVGRSCQLAQDCISAICTSGACQAAPGCDDGTQNGNESDVDCGGACPPCATTKYCSEHSDCLSVTCVNGVCRDATCDDGVRNQGESDVDCGGPCLGCAAGKTCSSPADCATDTCSGNTCVSCDVDEHVCADVCVSSFTTPTCGTRCSRCPEVSNGTATCDGTSCGTSCDLGYLTCDGSCTACPSAIPNATATCDAGACVNVCDVSYEPCETGCCTWHVQTVDAEGDVGEYLSMGIDSWGETHIAYFDATNQDLKYAHGDSGAWEIKTVDAVGSVGRSCSLHVTAFGSVRISYHDQTTDTLKVASSVSFEPPTIDVAVSDVSWSMSAMTRSASGTVYTTFCSYSGYLAVAFQGGGWQQEVVHNTNNTCYDASIAVDSAGTVHISYYNGSAANLGYARSTATSWSRESVDFAGDVGRGTALVLDSSDRPRIAYYDATERQVMYTAWNGTSWVGEVVDDWGFGSTSIRQTLSLALDSSDVPHLSYVNNNTGVLCYATRVGGNWVVARDLSNEGIGSVGGANTSIVLTGDDKPCIAYYGEILGDLKIACWGP